MVHLKYPIRLVCVTLLALALPASHSLTAGARATAGVHKRDQDQAGTQDRKDDDDDIDDKDEKAKKGPCRKALKQAEHGKRLSPECVAGSSSGIARGDFNGDEVGDLAVGIPFEDIGNVQDAGAVQIIYGSAGGLSATAGPGDQFLHQGSSQYAIREIAETGDRFGAALAAGDFNGDGLSDLAVGVPGENGIAGLVHVLYGSGGGLVGADSFGFVEFLRPEDPSPGDELGAALAWGNFNGDMFGDLAVGVPGRNRQAGEVVVYYSSGSSLDLRNPQIWSQARTDILGSAEDGDRFGAAVAAGDFGGDSASDLAIGVPGEDLAGQDAGAVNVIYGVQTVSLSGGLSAEGNQFWFQDSTGIVDANEVGDQFGSALAAIGFNGSDLAIGVPGEDVGTAVDAGGVNVIYRAPSGSLSSAGNQFWSQNTRDIEDIAETGDEFGAALAGGDFDGDTLRDLAVGVPGERLGSLADAGAVNVIYYASIGTGLTATAGPGDQFWHQDSLGIRDSADAGDRFGSALTAWNFGNGSMADLAVGVPFEDISGIQGAGAVNVIYSDNSNFPPGLRDIGNQFWHQNSPDIDDSAEAGDQFGRALY